MAISLFIMDCSRSDNRGFFEGQKSKKSGLGVIVVWVQKADARGLKGRLDRMNGCGGSFSDFGPYVRFSLEFALGA
jgi:hypothetical protein